MALSVRRAGQFGSAKVIQMLRLCQTLNSTYSKTPRARQQPSECHIKHISNVVTKIHPSTTSLSCHGSSKAWAANPGKNTGSWEHSSFRTITQSTISKTKELVSWSLSLLKYRNENQIYESNDTDTLSILGKAILAINYQIKCYVIFI